MSTLLCACGSEREASIDVGPLPDAGMGGSGGNAPLRACDMVERDGELVIERERDFTARYRVGEPYTRTVMLFGGEPLLEDNVLGNAYIIGLDKADAQRLAQRYPDFHLCSSPGADEAASYIVPYDLVPASCEVYDAIAAALRVFHRNRSAGGDRTSLRFEGAPLTLESVTADATGEDVTGQAAEQDFHLVTAVEQLTGESLLNFGTSE